MFFFCFCWTDLFTSVDVDLWFRFFHLSVPIGLQLLLFWFSTLSRFGCIFYCHPRFSALFFSIFFFKSTQRNNKLKRIYWFHLNKTNYILLLFFFVSSFLFIITINILVRVWVWVYFLRLQDFLLHWLLRLFFFQ